MIKVILNNVIQNVFFSRFKIQYIPLKAIKMYYSRQNYYENINNFDDNNDINDQKYIDYILVSSV